MAKFQLVNATVRLSGQMTHSVAKVGLTIPEVVMLRVVHGNDAVINIERMDIADMEDAHKDRAAASIGEEMARLRLVYGQKNVDAVFPGHNPRLPTTLRQLEQEMGDATLPPDNDAGLGGTVIA